MGLIEKKCTDFHFPKIEMKDDNVMIDGRNFLDQQAKNDLRIYDKKLYLVKEMFSQLAVYQTIFNSNRFK